jgi:UDP-hydrolysing UDP-N-acetyl-D-glucosamine 2-epimerase
MPGAGNTADDVTKDGFAIAATVDMEQAGDSVEAVTAGAGKAVAGFGKVFMRLLPDLLIVPGDRYEILGAVLAAALARIPVAHIAGGDITEGAMDDAFRHAVTKMSHLHFVTTEQAGARVRQMGEDPAHVFVVGSAALDRIRMIRPLERTEFFDAIGLRPRSKNVLVTFHPETLAQDTLSDCREMLAALDQLGPDVGLVFSGTNPDVQGLTISGLIQQFVRVHANAVLHPSLGSVRYFSALTYADAVVGNSSSGLYEAPSFGTPTVNIGNRQKGRARAESVIDVAPDRSAVHQAVLRAFAMGRRPVQNPYGDGHAAERIVAVIRALDDPQKLLHKRFRDLPSSDRLDGEDASRAGLGG